MPSRQAAILNGGESPVPAMIATAENLKRAGADFIIIGANTAHYFYDEVAAAVDVPFLHKIDEAVKETIKLVPNIKKAGVLATTAAMKTQLYQKSFKKFGIEVVPLPEEIQENVHNSIFDFKYNGVTEKNLDMMLSGVKYLTENGAQAIIMGCTEIPIILKDQSCSVPLIDPNDIIAKVAVAKAKNLI